ncbi:MAG: B12-binding domain-containing radical SAM protein, partial [Blastocatellia bacterium]
MERMFPPLSGMSDYQQRLRDITKASNELLFRVVEDVAGACEAGEPIPWSEDDILPDCREFLNSLMTE